VDRLVRRGLIKRQRGGTDRREVLLQPTARGERILQELSVHHREILKSAGPSLVGALQTLMRRVQHPAARIARRARTKTA
jgi:DNA-binding MarR family transcriptional regulator